MANAIIPILIVGLIIYSLKKKVNAYKSFAKGASTAFELILTIFPYILAIILAIEIYKISGLNIVLNNVFSPIFSFLGIPNELCELVLIKNFSGSGSIAILEDIFINYGVDSYVGECASIICASSEAVFYVSAIFFSKTNVEKMRYAIPLALLINFISIILTCFICKFI